MAHYNLPSFGRDAPFPPATDAGLWAQADGTLGQLGKSFRLDAEAFKDPDEPIRAIPDPWAQPRTFAEALIDGHHSMHRHALSQWRGLLATFALAGLRASNYVLTPRRVKLDGAHIFDRVLVHLTPQVAIGDQVGLWKEPWLVLATVKGEKPFPLAMTNSACLVSPGRNAATAILPGIAWAETGPTDPLALDPTVGLSVSELLVLARWLRGLQLELHSVGGDVSSRIRALLGEFADECETLAGPIKIEINTGPSLYQDLPDLFRGLWATAMPQPITDPAALSRTRLRLNPQLDFGELKGVILVDPDIANHAQFDPRRTFIWGTRTLTELVNSDDLFQETRKDAARLGYLLVRPEDFFTERAVRLDHQPMISGHPQGLQDMLLPVRPLALLLDLPLKQIVSCQSSSAQASATLSVRLDDESEGGFRHLMTRNYSSDTSSGRPLFVPDADWRIYNASVWPNFRSPAWGTYLTRFVYSASGKANMARPAQILSIALLASEIAVAGDGDAAVARLTELNAGKRPEQKSGRFLRSERNVGGEYEDMQYSATPIDAIYYVEAFGDRPDAAGGMVFLDLPEVETKAVSTVVAMDFGTTNTVACFEDLKPITFETRRIIPIKYKDANKTRDAEHSARWLLNRFLPPEKRLTPTPTVVLTRTAFPNNEAIWAFRNLVYFHSTLRPAANSESKELQQFQRVIQDAKFNLKWNDDAAHVQAATDYLEHFMTMVAAEGAAAGRDPRQILWRFSVPDSLSPRRRDQFESSLSAITRRISSDVEEGKGVKILAPLYSEGLAAARHILADAGFNPQSLNIVLDIGGGTTDVTIWDVDQLVWKGSFRIAGQNFFTRAISQNPEILKPIGLEDWASLFGSSDGKQRTIATDLESHLAEILFSGPILQSAIDEHWETKLNIGPGKKLRITALVFLAGLAWYIGMIVRKLVADGVIDAEQIENPAFALCGRGAGIFKKMHGGREADAESDVTRALQVFGRAAGVDTRPMPQLFTTSDAKLEVVRGMMVGGGLIDASVKSGRAGAREYLPAGVGVEFRGGNPLPADGMTGEMAFKERVKTVDLAPLSEFLQELEAVEDIALNLYPDRAQGAFGMIQNAVRTQIDKATQEGETAESREPPFIMALRTLVDQLALPTDVQAKQLSMDFRT
ncbi:hypothetical protein [Sphingomonas sp. LT1P40]|uniref:hypothetical protein n=1 Tax=Alteristakelama amylovorans TaxID=3096166 RepID=UPI002FC8CD65